MDAGVLFGAHFGAGVLMDAGVLFGAHFGAGVLMDAGVLRGALKPVAQCEPQHA